MRIIKYIIFAIALSLIASPAWPTTVVYSLKYLYDNNDVDSSISTAIANDILSYNGTVWTNSADIVVNSIFYSGSYYDDLRVALFTAKANPVTAPDYGVFIGNTYAWYFDDTVAGERLEFDSQLPHTYKEGEAVEIHAHINSGSNSNTGNVEVIAECTNFADFSIPTFTGTTIYNGVVAVDGTTYKNYYVDLGNIDGTGVTISSTIYCALSRGVSVGGDVTGDFVFTTVDFHVPIDSPGSRSEESK